MAEFLVEETAVREAGESHVFDCGENAQNLSLTLGITHAIEQESIEVLIFDSRDGVRWKPIPLVRFTPKYYCGLYQITMAQPHERYLKAAWRVERWGSGVKPYFGFYLQCTAPATRQLVLAAV
jgi:hypothetical protein